MFFIIVLMMCQTLLCAHNATCRSFRLPFYRCVPLLCLYMHFCNCFVSRMTASGQVYADKSLLEGSATFSLKMLNQGKMLIFCFLCQ